MLGLAYVFEMWLCHCGCSQKSRWRWLLGSVSQMRLPGDLSLSTMGELLTVVWLGGQMTNLFCYVSFWFQSAN